MPTYERKGWFTAELPDGWEAHEEEGVVTLHHPDRPGALHVTSQTLEHRRPGDRIDVFLALRAYLRGTGIKMKPSQANNWTRDGIEVATYEHVTMEPEQGPTFWRTWFLTNQDVLSLVTYNCPDADREVERGEVDKLMQSMKFTSLRSG